MTLDTLAVVRKLQAAGFSEDQAEAVTNVVRDAQDSSWSGLATKADLDAVKVTTKSEYDSFKIAIKADFDSFKAATKADLRELDAKIDKLDAKIDKVELRLDAKIEGLRKDMRGDIESSKFELVRWYLLTQVALAGFIFTLFKYMR